VRDTRFPPRSQNNRIIFLIYLAIHISFANIFTWLAPWSIREVTTTGRDDLAIGYGNIKMSNDTKQVKQLTEQEMTKIIKEKTISNQTEEVKKQVMAFAFGEEFMASEDKGEKVTYSKDDD